MALGRGVANAVEPLAVEDSAVDDLELELVLRPVREHRDRGERAPAAVPGGGGGRALGAGVGGVERRAVGRDAGGRSGVSRASECAWRAPCTRLFMPNPMPSYGSPSRFAGRCLPGGA